jgi:hypothetical protein
MIQAKLFIICIVLGFCSCSKKNDVNQNDNFGINEVAINQVLQAKNPSEQKSMYKLLNQYEKTEIWKRKYKSILSSKDLSSEQRNFIIKIQNLITPDIFSPSVLLSKKSFDDTEIKALAIKLFGVSDAHSLLTSIVSTPFIQQYATLSSDCGCSKDSDWCSGALVCQNAGCASSGGCGTFWVYSCNGNCQKQDIYIIPIAP